ncbi:hypothetical protein M0813_03468 [Anaeramoeba flamelloides]|uniref:WD repeat-containing protein n=1 Tax=Anaeramoeba flamelloides TaxID=1746091 RepID=A0ABQ8XWX7_9EUKA|nr:hypothetical protein M0813_03468 [Anaeramoeba flamelloides]
MSQQSIYSRKEALYYLKPLKTKFGSREGKYKLQQEFFVENDLEFNPNIQSALNYPSNESATYVSVNKILFHSEKNKKETFKTTTELVYNYKNGLYVFDLFSGSIDFKNRFLYYYPILHFQIKEDVHQSSLILAVLFKNNSIFIQNQIEGKSYTINKDAITTKVPFTAIKFVPDSENSVAVSDIRGRIWFFSWKLKDPQNKNYGIQKKDLMRYYKNNSGKNPFGIVNCGKHFIKQFEYSNDLNKIAYVDKGGFFRIINLLDEKIILSYKSLFGGFTCLSWSEDDAYVLTGGEDDIVCLWDVKNRCLLARCLGHQNWVSSVKFDVFFMNYLENTNKFFKNNIKIKNNENINKNENENENEKKNECDGDEKKENINKNENDEKDEEKENEKEIEIKKGNENNLNENENKKENEGNKDEDEEMETNKKSKNNENEKNQNSEKKKQSEDEIKINKNDQIENLKKNDKKKKTLRFGSVGEDGILCIFEIRLQAQKKNNNKNLKKNANENENENENENQKQKQKQKKKEFGNDLTQYCEIPPFNEEDDLNYYPIVKRKVSYSPLSDLRFTTNYILVSTKTGIVKSFIRPTSEKKKKFI